MQESNPLPGVPLIESPLFEALLPKLDASLQPVARALHEDGFAVIDFPREDFGELADALVARMTPLYDFDGWRRRKAAGQSGGLRVQDAGLQDPEIQRLVHAVAANENIMALLSELYGRRAFPFQTLTFPVGTEQHYHTDALHFSSIPEKFMCGVWVALEDIGPDQGPLLYYPGSHRLPVLWSDAYFAKRIPAAGRTQAHYEEAWRAVVDALQLEPMIFEARKGQALIWAANLLHGGTRHRDTALTRWSHVTHYYFEDCAYVTPIFSDPLEGRYVFKDVINLATGEPVPQRYLGDSLAEAKPSTVPGQPLELPHDFDPERYLALHPDVARAGVKPENHYLAFGWKEGRRYR